MTEVVFIGNRRVTGGDVLKVAVGAARVFLDPAAAAKVGWWGVAGAGQARTLA